MTQLFLFDEFHEQQRSSMPNDSPSLDRFEGAMLCSTIGDALGWPTEFLKPGGRYKPPFSLPVQGFVAWQKVVGGKWWGYEDKIGAGQYSDDTQLALAIARCITEMGEFEPEHFAYEELPLWLQYERGGGKSVKTAARKLIGKQANWQRNFYKQGDLSYKHAGANGAAMRNLPIALANIHDKPQLIRDSFYNSIITHGHPRAIVGAILFALAVNCAITNSGVLKPEQLINCILDGLRQVRKVIKDDEYLIGWVNHWNEDRKGNDLSFGELLKQTLQETAMYLRDIPDYLQKEVITYYTFVGALDPVTKGSGIGTVCVAIYLFLKYLERPEEALITAVNTFGSDTDTISVFLGSLLGAYHGSKAVPDYLIDHVQDRNYLLKTADRLHSIATGTGKTQAIITVNRRKQRQEEAYFRILAWEIGLHEMFWDQTCEGDDLVHPTLGHGIITKQEEKSINREGYVAKLIHVNFDCGQSCVFHSRVENNERVAESLAHEVANALA